MEKNSIEEDTIAIYKQITDDIGLTTSYHRIDGIRKAIRKGSSCLLVTISSYANKDMRLYEKEFGEIESYMMTDEYVKESFELTGADENILSEEQLARKKELEEMMTKYEELVKYHKTNLSSNEYTIPYNDEDDISYAGVYKWLSENEDCFKDSEVS